ncbi:hypothetical protein GPJ56_004234 [Histomonas meleagridis]|uniref:uncharacterized protein n=1 Tax=Histomonas meleagridis TaxID=135588 RepID=UPI00355AC3BA|nr:hypothetical protein GPJ56_004234 [Histomonas meleagridis]KAH0802217.1 hypothetical protein GO595_004830 [Histomonas meleagridis]
MEPDNKNKQKPVDRSKLKSFRDITHLQSRSTSYSRRQIPRLPMTIFMKRLNSAQDDDSDDSSSSSFVEPMPVMETCQCIKKKNTNIRGTRIFFQLVQNGHALYSAKYKSSKSTDYIPISSGEKVHFKSETLDGALLFTNQMSDFSLRKSTKFGEELLSILLRKDITEEEPRSITVYFFGSDSLPPKLMSAKPQYNPQTEEWFVDLGTDEALSSIKNSRLEDENHMLYAYVRKTAKNVLEVEARTCIDKMRVFAIAIASFLCDL